MSNKRSLPLLKSLVVFYWAIGSLDVGAAIFASDSLPLGLQAWLDTRAAMADTTSEWLLRIWMMMILLALIAGTVGIYRERPWGRWLFAGANVVMFASYPLLEVMVYTWFGGLFADLSMVTTGALLWACFVSQGVNSSAVLLTDTEDSDATGSTED